MKNGANPLRGKRVLVIEDEYLVAQVVVDILEEAGAEVVGPLGWIEEALAFIAKYSSSLDAAVVDINLHGQKSYPIADALAANNIAFVFTTGYGSESLSSHYLRFPRCIKPFGKERLIEAISKA